MDRLVRKFETCRAMVPRPVVENTEGAEIGLIGCGTSHYAITEARDQLRDEHGIETSYLRFRSFPFNDDLVEFAEAHKRVYIVDQNRDAQLLQLIRLDQPELAKLDLRSIRHYAGMPIDARSVSDAVVEQERS